MATLNDVLMTDSTAVPQKLNDYSDLLQTDHTDAFAFTDQEQLALDLYDQLKEIELQHSLLKAQGNRTDDVLDLSDDAVQEQLIIAEREAMDAKAEYELRNRITHNVLLMDPVLKAVHGGEGTDFSEQRLLPLIHENDVVSMVHGNLASKLASIMKAMSTAEQGNIVANDRNAQLAKEMLELAEEARAQSTDDIDNSRLRERVNEVEKNVRESRRRAKTLKGIVSGMLVGSGINWAENEELRELVMDDEDD